MSSFAMNDGRTPDAHGATIIRSPRAAVAADLDAGPAEVDPISGFLLRHWLIISVAAILGTVAGFGLSFVLPKVYRAEILVQPVSADSGSPLRSLLGQYGGALAEVAGGGGAGRGLLGAVNPTAAVVALLKSRLFIEAFITDNNLLPVLFHKRWDQEHGRWRLKPGQNPPTIQDAYGMFTKTVMHVEEDKEKGLITINIEWTDASLAADWANALVQRLNEGARRRALANSDRSIDYLNKELERTQTVEIRNSIYSVLEQQINNRMLANTRPDFAFSVIDPAQAPEPNKYVRPIPLLLAAIGFFAGALCALFAVVLVAKFSRFARLRRDRSKSAA